MLLVERNLINFVKGLFSVIFLWAYVKLQERGEATKWIIHKRKLRSLENS